MTRVEPAEAIHRLLHPRGVAVVGVSSQRDNFGRRFFRNALRSSNSVPIVAVNPRHGENTLLGAPCFPDLLAVPDDVDVAILVQPPDFIPEALEQCRQRNLPVVQVISASLGGAGVESAAGPRIVGPNSYGCLNPWSGLASYGSAALEEAMPRPGGIAMVSHSGAVSGVFVDLLAHRGLGLRAVVTTGDEVDLDALDVVSYLVADERTDVIAWYLEGLPDRERMEQCAEQLHHAGKQLVVLASGRTEAGRETVMSHTGHAASDARAMEAFLSDLGIVQARSMHELVAISQAFDHLAPAPGAEATVVTTTGGVVALAVDEFVEQGVSLATLTEQTRTDLAPVLGEFVTPRNPVDVGPGVLASGVQAIHDASAVLASHGDEQLLVFVTSVVPWAVPAIRAFWSARGRAPAVVLWLTGGSFVGNTLEEFAEEGIPVFLSPHECAAAVSALIRVGAGPRRRVPAVQRDGASLGVELPPEAVRLSETASKRILAAAGLALPRSWERGAIGSDVFSDGVHSVVVKGMTDDVLSRGAAGLIRLDVQTPDDLATAVADVTERARELSVHLDGVLIEEQISARLEVFVGARTDLVLGTVAAVGLGGDLLAAVERVGVRPFPLDDIDIDEMFRSTGIDELLRRSFGGDPPVAELRSAVVRVLDLAASVGARLESLDVNPLAVTAGGRIVVLDASLTLRATP